MSKPAMMFTLRKPLTQNAD